MRPFFPAWAGPRTSRAGPDRLRGNGPQGTSFCWGTPPSPAKVDCDHGIAAQTILLGAAEKGLAGCMLGSVNRNRLQEILALPDGLDILLVLALGVPAETRTLEPVGDDGSIKYYRDEKGVHHVPKRSLAEVLVAVYS